jgi:hypothetical protein
MALLNLREYLPDDEMPVCLKRFDTHQFLEHLLFLGNAFTEKVDVPKCTDFESGKHKKDVDYVYGKLLDPMHVVIYPETKEYEVR